MKVGGGRWGMRWEGKVGGVASPRGPGVDDREDREEGHDGPGVVWDEEGMRRALSLSTVKMVDAHEESGRLSWPGLERRAEAERQG
jgi:hypothetical protein